MLAKSKLNSTEFLISKTLIDALINHDKFVLINNVQKEYNEMKGEIRIYKLNIKFIKDFSLFIK